MGCVASRIDKEERVRICKDRKRLMKQLLGHRKEFADAQLAYLRSLRNTGVTLRQFTESDSLELEDATSGTGFPPSPPPPLPPSPPPPPTFSPDLRKSKGKQPQLQQAQMPVEEIIEMDESSGRTPPPPVPSSSWEYWDPFGHSSMLCEGGEPPVEQDEDNGDDEDNWADTNSEFVQDEEVDLLQAKPPPQSVELVDDSLSMMSSHTKDSSDMAMVVWSKKTLAGVVKDVDEYFLKASGVVKDIAVFIDIDANGTFMYEGINKSKSRKGSSSSKVFSALTFNWSSKLLQPSREAGGFSVLGEPCKPGAHCITLQNLCLEEQKLYKDVKEEETSKAEHRRKTLLLKRQEEEQEWSKVEKTQMALESLQTDILSLQESIGRSSLTISTLINQELHPQLIALASGLMHTWQTMHNCHQVQNHLSQQLSHVTDQKSAEPTTEYHQQAAAQLQTEVASWYDSFFRLVKFQREYVRVLSKWANLTECLENADSAQSGNSSKLRTAVKNWLQELDQLPDKMVSEAIKGLLSSIHMIVIQQREELNARKRSEKMAKKLDRELTLLSEMEAKFPECSSLGDANSALTSKHPLAIRCAKVEALRRMASDEKAKHASSVKTTSAMILSNLQTSLPKLFQALMVYSSACVQSFEEVLSNAAAASASASATPAAGCDEDTPGTAYGSLNDL